MVIGGPNLKIGTRAGVVIVIAMPDLPWTLHRSGSGAGRTIVLKATLGGTPAGRELGAAQADNSRIKSKGANRIFDLNDGFTTVFQRPCSKRWARARLTQNSCRSYSLVSIHIATRAVIEQMNRYARSEFTGFDN